MKAVDKLEKLCKLYGKQTIYNRFTTMYTTCVKAKLSPYQFMIMFNKEMDKISKEIKEEDLELKSK